MLIPVLLVLVAMIMLGACFTAYAASRNARVARDQGERFFAAASACLRLDAQARCTHANRAAAERLGARRDDLVGRDLAAIVTSPGAAATIEAIRTGIAERRAWRPDGPVAGDGPLSGASLEPAPGEFLLWLGGPEAASRGAGDDVADAVAAERRRADAAMAELRHDLMQPLAAIHNYAELIRRGCEPPLDDYAGSILRIAGQMVVRVRSGPAGPGAA